MTSLISKLSKIAVPTLVIVTFVLNFSPVHAESLNEIGDITNLTEKIARNPLQPAPIAETRTNPNDTKTSSVREQSMEYVKSGYEAEQAGNVELALRSYYKAMQIDLTNGYSFLMAGNLLRETKIGTECLQVAIELFKDQKDTEGYEIAQGLLKTTNSSY